MDYNTFAKGYNELYGEEQLRKLKIIKSLLNLKSSDKLLDVGCGTGLSRMLNCKITGIDSCEELIKKSKIKTNKLKL